MSGALKVRKVKHDKVEAHTYRSTEFWCLDPIIYHVNMNITVNSSVYLNIKYISANFTQVFITSLTWNSLTWSPILTIKDIVPSCVHLLLDTRFDTWFVLIAGCSGNGYSCGKAGPVHCTRWSAPFCCEFPTTSEDF
jgi:hypothetical protein